MKHYTFTVKGKPTGKMRPRVVKRGKFVSTYTPKKTVEYEERVKQCAIDAGVTVMDYCKVLIEVYLPMRVKKFKTKPDEYLEPRMRSDLDNICKSILDAIEGVGFGNDKDVIGLESYYVFTKENEPYVKVQMIECDWTDYQTMERGTNDSPKK